MIKKIFSLLISFTIKKQLRNFWTLAHDYAQYKTIKSGLPIDKDGKEVPWYTYPAIEFLNHLDFSDKTIFEWGSGSSSVYWAIKAREVMTVETDELWMSNLEAKKRGNQKVTLIKDKDKYINSILDLKQKFSVIIIDDKYRNECVNNAYVCLEDGGMIILDNSDWFPEAVESLRGFGLIQVDFHGFGPVNSYTWTTSIFFNKDYKFNYLKNLCSLHAVK